MEGLSCSIRKLKIHSPLENRGEKYNPIRDKTKATACQAVGLQVVLNPCGRAEKAAQHCSPDALANLVSVERLTSPKKKKRGFVEKQIQGGEREEV